MLDYEKELKNFKPSLEVEEIEDAVYQEDFIRYDRSSKTGHGPEDKVKGYDEIDGLYGKNPAPVKLRVQ